MKCLLPPALGCCLLLGACASGPATRLFVLAAPAAEDDQPATAGPPVQLQTVLVPDYLDTTDILVRAGPHEVVASRTGRWSERLSQGFTHALQAGLTSRLRNGRLTLNPPADPIAGQVLVTVDALDAWPDGHCVLAAHWTILRRATDADGQDGRGSFTGPPSTTTDDAARVAAIAGVVDQLAARIAASVHEDSNRSSLTD